ncbi:MAG: nucleotidyltransferase domain-containing protein [Candidatus Peregrinibacteria bacterium]
MGDYISTTEAAEKMGVSRITVFNMIKDGRIKRAIKVGRNYIIPADFQKDFIEDIAAKIIPILKKHDVKRAGIFGSRACGSEYKHSDLDVLVDLDPQKSLMDVARLKVALEEYLGMTVDVLTYDGIHHLLKDRILKQQIAIL